MVIFLCLLFYILVPANWCRHCNLPLGVSNGSLPDARMNASSTSDRDLFGAHRGRLTGKHITKGWCSSLGRISKEYIEIDLGIDTRLSAFETKGVLFWNKTTRRYDYNYVKQFYLAYKRNNDEQWRWRQYRENEVTVTLFKSNGSVKKYKLLTPRIARYVRLVVISAKGPRACFKVELYGCPWTKQDGLVSYRVSQGNGRANGPGLGDLRDIGYDGRRLAYGTKRGVLSGGLGQLVDGVSGRNVPWNDTNNTAWIAWIGWRDPITEHPTVTFQFLSIRRFEKIRFHVLNQPGAEKLLFGKVVVSFSNDGEYYAWKTVFEPSLQKRRMKNRAFLLEVSLNNYEGKYVTCDFYYHGWWILLSEVEFESGIFEQGKTHINDPSGSNTNNNSSPSIIPTEIVLDVKDRGRPKKKGSSDIILYTSIAAGTVAGLLLAAGIILFLRRKCKRRLDNAYANPIRIVNPLKKNSINRNNERKFHAVKKKTKILQPDANDDIDNVNKKDNRNREDDLKGDLEKFQSVKDDRQDDLKLQIMTEFEAEEDEEVFFKLNSWKANFGESLFKDIVTSDETANLRPESREITLEDEKALVLEEMRKLSDNLDDPGL